MKKILIGTHNYGKFKEIAYLLPKKYKKISPIKLKIKSPKETGKTFISNAKLKVKYFSKFVDYDVISDDSGLCVKALNNRPGIIYYAWKKNGSLNSVNDFSFKNKIKGNKGFGYDPIFIPKGQKITFGQMSKLRKIKMDHRFIAYSKLVKRIKI